MQFTGRVYIEHRQPVLSDAVYGTCLHRTPPTSHLGYRAWCAIFFSQVMEPGSMMNESSATPPSPRPIFATFCPPPAPPLPPPITVKNPLPRLVVADRSTVRYKPACRGQHVLQISEHGMQDKLLIFGAKPDGDLKKTLCRPPPDPFRVILPPPPPPRRTITNVTMMESISNFKSGRRVDCPQ